MMLIASSCCQTPAPAVTLPPGGSATQQLKFYYPFGTTTEALTTPTKFLLELNPTGIGIPRARRTWPSVCPIRAWIAANKCFRPPFHT